MSVNVIEQKTLSAFKSYSNRQAKLDERRGRRDGARGTPPATGGYYPFCDAVLAEGRRRLQEYEIELGAHESKLQQRIERLTQACDEGYRQRLGDLQNEQENRLNELYATKGAGSRRFERAVERKDHSQRQFERVEARVQRPLRTHLRYLYLPLMAVFAVLEVPVNRLAFELFFQETPVVSLGISLMLGLVLIFFAHFLGTWLAQGPNYENRWARFSRLGGAVMIVVVVAPLIYFVAKLRQGYVQLAEQAETQSFSALLQGSGISEFAQSSLSVPLDTAGYTLLFVNVAIFLIGTIVAFARHDPDPDYERAVHDLEAAARRLDRMQTRFEKRAASIKKQFDERMGYLHRQIDSSEEQIEQLKREIDAAGERRAQNALMVAQVLRQRLINYQIGNQDGRADGRIPEVFKTLSEEEILKNLERSVADPSSSESVVNLGALGRG